MPDFRDPSYFDAEEKALEQKRKMLQEILREPAPESGYKGKFYVPNFGATQKGLQDAFTMYGQSGLDSEAQDIAKRRAEAAQKWLDKMPQGTAAQPEVNPSAPLAGEEGPPLPTNYAPPPEPTGGIVPQVPAYEHKDATPFLPASLRDVSKWSLEGAGFSPLHGAIAAKTYEQALTAQARAEEKRLEREARAAEALDKRREREHERDLANIEWERRQTIASADREKATAISQAQAAADRENYRINAAADRAALRGGNAADVPAGDYTKTGEDFLKTLPAENQAVIKKIAAGEIPLTSFSTRGGHREELARQASAYDPTFNVTRAATWRDFTTGQPGKNLTSINTSLAHMGTMADLTDALKNGDVQAINRITNFVATQTGDPRINNFETAKQAVAEELMRTFRVVGASEREAAAWEKRFASAGSPEQLHGAITTAAQLLKGRIDAVDDQWKRGTGSKEGFPGAISPENEAVLARLGVKRKGSAAAASGGAPAGADYKRAQDASGKWWRRYSDGRVVAE